MIPASNLVPARSAHLLRALVLFFLLGAPAAWAQRNAGSTNNTITTSTSSSKVVHTTNSAEEANNYLTRITARIGNAAPVYDQTFSALLSDSQVQAAIQQAKTQLTGAGAVNINGPNLLSDVRALASTNQNTVVNSSQDTQTVTLEDTVGPATIIIGNRDLGGTAFQVLAGTANLNINTHTTTDIFQTVTTTTTYLTTQVYELVGTSGPAIASMAQVAAAGGWDTLFTAVNLGTAQASAHANFYADNGTPLTLPLNLVSAARAAVSTTPAPASSFDQTLNPNASVVIDATGAATGPAVTGWSQFQTAGGIGAFGIFRYPAAKWEAVVPLETRNASGYLVAFDNTGAVATGVAVANAANTTATIPVIVRDDTGAQIGTSALILPAQGHLSFMLNQQYPITVNKRGTVEFQTPGFGTQAAGQISVLGLRANGGALTTLPVIARGDSGGGAIAHATYNGGFTSVFYIVNPGTAAADFTLSFFNENGTPLSAPLKLPQSGTTTTTAALTRTLAPGAMLVVETQASDTAASVVGSAQMTTTGSISGFEIFLWTTFGQEASVPLERRAAKSFVLVFDNTGDLTTGVALSNFAAAATNISAKIYDDSGALLQTVTIALAGHGHTSFMLPTTYASAAGKRGMVEFVVPTGGSISAIGLRAKGDGTLTTIPVLMK